MHREFVTGFRRARPRRSYQNFRAFRHTHETSFANRRINCPECQGSGKGTKEACRQAYQKVVETHQQEKGEYDRLTRLRREALQKSTKDKSTALRELGI